MLNVLGCFGVIGYTRNNMAGKRMVTLKIVDSDAFLDMPQTTQNLYFHLAMRVDDDGFVDGVKKIMKIIGSSDDDFKVLVTKKFVIAFESGVIVLKHHRMNNNWDKYNCKRTQYVEELSRLYIKENGAYTLDKTQGLPVIEGYQTANRLQPVSRIEENRIEENILNTNTLVLEKEKNNTKKKKDWKQDPEFFSFYQKYKNKIAPSKAYESWVKLSEEEKKLAMNAIEVQIKNDHFKGRDGKDYIPYPATWLNQKRWEDEVKIKKDAWK